MRFYRYYTHVSTSSYGLRQVSVELKKYKLVKETPKGYWITNDWDYGIIYFKRWIPKKSLKRHAYPTKEEAMKNYIKRTEKYTSILKGRLADALDGLAIVKKEEGR